MRLLLDEHFMPRLAQQLRERGHDVLAVVDVGPRGAADPELLVACAADRRAIATENVRHFAPLARRWTEEGSEHYGIVLCSPRTIRRSTDAIGAYVRAFVTLLDANPADDALRSAVRWVRA